jgi:hypothetical protein
MPRYVLDRHRPRGHLDRKIREGPCAPAASVFLDMSLDVGVSGQWLSSLEA